MSGLWGRVWLLSSSAAYRKVGEDRKLRPGQILPYRKGQPWILNLAVKDDWKHTPRLEWVEACLEQFAASYRQLGITSVAFPWIWAMNGGLPWDKVHALVRSYLRPLEDIDVEVIEFDPDAPDPLFVRLCQSVQSQDASVFARQIGITQRAAALVYQAVREAEVPSLVRLGEFPALGNNNTPDTISVRFTDGPGNFLGQFTLSPSQTKSLPPIQTNSAWVHVNVTGPKGKTGLNTFGVNAKDNVLRVKINKGTNRYDVRRE